MSSNSPMGTNPDRQHRFDELSPYAPYMGYGRSKMEMERMVAGTLGLMRDMESGEAWQPVDLQALLETLQAEVASNREINDLEP